VRKTTGDPLVGTDVAHYAVEARLGGGGMGVVYAARDTKLGRRVALKFLPPQWSHDESAKQRFMREAQAASATDHPNICTIHDIGSTDDGQLFIVMAYYDGQTLKTRLESGRLSLDEAVDIAAQVAEGLAKAHSQGVVHRDIKPGNLMLTEDGVRILDFGLAKFADARLKLTLEGSTIGTIAYMSPEQARGEEADARSDVWAVGVVLYEMLTGGLPFKGGYPEAIAHAIKNDPPPPIRDTVPEVSEALEQLVFRALYKERPVRVQSARELARALRLLQGRTLPLDLRTETLPQGDSVRTLAPPRPRWWRSRRTARVAAVLAVVLVGAPIWMFSPVDRIPVAVAPVGNQTGYAELDAYRMALTRELVAQVSESASIRVLPYDQLLQIVRRFQAAGQDVSSREAMQALTTYSGARVILVPTLLYENGEWHARVEFRRADTGTGDGVYETASVVSSLIKDTAYGLMPQLGDGIEAHFLAAGPQRAYFAHVARRFAGWSAPARAPRLRTLDAAAEFERALDAYSQQEYATARRGFASAAARDERSPVLMAWRSRAAGLVRLDTEAAEAAEAASRLLTDRMPSRERLFVEAVAAEARRDVATARARHQALVAAFPDEAEWRMELAAFQDRHAINADATAQAIATYLEALTFDRGLTRADLELCRLYGPVRQNERVLARQHGQRSLDASRSIGDRIGEAHALVCLTEVLRFGNDDDRREAQRSAETARQIFADAGATYSLPRAELNVALGAAAQGRFAEAATLFGQALESARRGGNRVLEPLLLMNLGVAQVRLGNRAEAASYYQASSDLYEALADERRAAQQQANSAALRIEYGDEPDQALRDMQNALGVFQKLGEKNLEAFCLQVIAAYYRQAGRHADAERELNRALAILRERNLEDDIASVTIDRARSQIDTGSYATAATLLAEVAANSGSPFATAARIHHARALARLGDVAGAEASLAQAAPAVANDNDLLPLFHLTRGEIAYDGGRLADAREAFGRAASLSSATLPDAASVEARAWISAIDALGARPSQGRAVVQASLEQAERMGRPGLAARCRLFLAQIDLRQRRAAEALQTLSAIPPDDAMRTIGPELRAQVHYWRSVAAAGLGDPAGAQTDALAARKILEQIRATLPESSRASFAARPDIRRIVG
jgi:tetratricopeptide (TPR) repeat protein